MREIILGLNACGLCASLMVWDSGKRDFGIAVFLFSWHNCIMSKKDLDFETKLSLIRPTKNTRNNDRKREVLCTEIELRTLLQKLKGPLLSHMIDYIYKYF